MRRFACVALLLLSCAVAVVSAATDSPPNLLVLLVDDLGYGDIGAYGNTTIKTPHIDSLARDGVKLTQMLTAAPVCTPSRAALLTGRYPVRSGMASSNPVFRTISTPAQTGGLPAREYTLAEMLKDNGYTTAMVGKWHLGVGDDVGSTIHLPNHQGFDSYYGMPVTNVQACGGKSVHDGTLVMFAINKMPRLWISLVCGVVAMWALGAIGIRGVLVSAALMAGLMGATVFYAVNYTLMSPKACILHANDTLIEQPVKLQNLTRRFTDKAVEFLDAQKESENPFFLFMSYAKVHTALFTMPEFEGVSAAGAYGDNVEETDWSVGRILAALEASGKADNTLVVFSSDNGPFIERGLEGGFSGRVADNTGTLHKLRGAKGQNWEGGIRVPGLVRWPAVLPKGKVATAAVSQMDVYATMLEAVAGRQPVGMPIDGRSFVPVLESEGANVSAHEFLIHYCGDAVTAIRKGKYKAHYYTPVWEEGCLRGECCPSGPVCSCVGRGAIAHNPPLVFDLDADPGESHPLKVTKEIEALVGEMAVVIEEHKATVKPVVNQLESFAWPSMFPCCNPPSCECEEGGTR